MGGWWWPGFAYGYGYPWYWGGYGYPYGDGYYDGAGYDGASSSGYDSRGRADDYSCTAWHWDAQARRYVSVRSACN